MRQTIPGKNTITIFFKKIKFSNSIYLKSFVESRTAASFPLGPSPASPDALSLPLRRKTIVIASSSDKDPSFPFPPASQRRSLKNLTPSPFPPPPSGRVTNQEKEGRESAVCALASIFSRGIYRALEVCVCVCPRAFVRPWHGRGGFFFPCTTRCDPDSSP